MYVAGNCNLNGNSWHFVMVIQVLLRGNWATVTLNAIEIMTLIRTTIVVVVVAAAAAVAAALLIVIVKVTITTVIAIKVIIIE